MRSTPAARQPGSPPAFSVQCFLASSGFHSLGRVAGFRVWSGSRRALTSCARAPQNATLQLQWRPVGTSDIAATVPGMAGSAAAWSSAQSATLAVKPTAHTVVFSFGLPLAIVAKQHVRHTAAYSPAMFVGRRMTPRMSPVPPHYAFF